MVTTSRLSLVTAMNTGQTISIRIKQFQFYNPFLHQVKELLQSIAGFKVLLKERAYIEKVAFS